MARWLVQLSGDRIDAEEYPKAFPDGDLFAVEEKGVVYLTGPALESFPDASAVQQECERRLQLFTAAILLRWPQLKKPTIGHVIHEDDNGRRDLTVSIGVGRAEMRSKASAVFVSDNGGAPPEFTAEQQLLRKIKGNPNLETAFTLLADGNHSWPRLYRMLEEVEQHLGTQVDKAGVCRQSERTRFTRTANTAEVSGADSRHSQGKFTPPDKPMTPKEGAEFVRGILQKVPK